MYRFVKWLVSLSIAFLVLIYLSIISAYYYGLRGLPEDTSPSKISFSTDLLRMNWVALGETGEIQMTPLSPAGYLGVVVNYLNFPRQNDLRFVASPGLRIADEAASVLNSRRKIRSERNLSWRFYESVATIWITNHWSAYETLNTLLENGYFGLSKSGVQAAAKEYFKKEHLQLNIQEIALLFALQKSPSIYDPWCHKERALAQANLLLEKLSENWPQKYEKPEMLKETPASLVNRNSELCGGR